MLSRGRSTWRALRRRASWEHDLDAELRSHVELRAAHLERDGLTPEQALRRARLELGASETYKEQCRQAHGLRWFDDLHRDVRFAGRQLRSRPSFALVAMLSLALGIGANTVVFSVLNALLLKPLPVASPERLYFVQGGKMTAESYPDYLDLRDHSSAFTALAAYRVAPMGLEATDGSHRVWGYLATGNYFDTLGVRPALGRFFQPEDDRRPGGSPFVVLSHACWRSRFGADRRIVGRTVRINTLPYTVLGVAPAGFHGTEQFYWPEAWVPMAMQPQIEGHSWLELRGTHNCWVMGRLAPGVTPARAAANLNAIAATLAREYPDTDEGLGLTLTQPGLVGDQLRAPVRAFTGGVMALACLVLIAACANLASLMAARAADRHREMAVRLAIGAGRARIVRQLLVEALLLALLGGAAGYALAGVLLRLLSRWRAPLDFPVQLEVGPDLRVLGFALGATLLTGLLFGLAPARQAWGTDPGQAMKGAPARRRGTRPARRLAMRDLLLAVQVGLCCLLLTASFVALRGMLRSLATPLGFDARDVAVAGLDLSLAGYDAGRGRAFQRRALEAIAHLPGVAAAAYSNSVPLSIDQSTSGVLAAEETEFRASKAIPAGHYQVSPGYFRALGTQLLAGRDFTWHDDDAAPRVAIVNRTFARRVLGAEQAVGRRFSVGGGRPIEVIGVAEDGKYVSLNEEARAVFFEAAAQSYNSTTTLLVRSSRPDPDMPVQLGRAIAALDPGLPQYGVGTLQQMLGLAFLPARAATLALSAFGLLAIMLAGTGIYGLAAYTVSRRSREIGIRMAVGARPRQVLAFVLGRTLLLLAAGSALGLALGFAAGRLLGSVVYQASPRDPLVVAAVAATMTAIGLAAVWPPARRAMEVDPVGALRAD